MHCSVKHVAGATVCDAGFDVRNYVAIAFCVVWFIVDNILVLGIYRVRQHYMRV